MKFCLGLCAATFLQVCCLEIIFSFLFLNSQLKTLANKDGFVTIEPQNPKF